MDRAAVENVFYLRGIRALHVGLLYVGSLLVLLVYSILYGLIAKESNWLGAITSAAVIILDWNLGAFLYGFKLLKSRVVVLFVAGTSRVFLIYFGVHYCDKSIDSGRPSLALRSSSFRSVDQDPEVGSSYVDRNLEHNSSLVFCSSSGLESQGGDSSTSTSANQQILDLNLSSSLDADQEHRDSNPPITDSNDVENVLPNHISFSKELRLQGLGKWLQRCRFEFGIAVLLLSPVVCSILVFLRSLQAEDLSMISKPRKMLSVSTINFWVKFSTLLQYGFIAWMLSTCVGLLLSFLSKSSVLLGLSLTVPLMVACLSIAIPIWIRNGYQFWSSRAENASRAGNHLTLGMKEGVVLFISISLFAGSILALGAIVSAKPLDDLDYKGWTGGRNSVTSPYASSVFLGWAMVSAIALVVTAVIVAFCGVSYFEIVGPRTYQIPTKADFLASLLPLICIPAVLSLGAGLFKWKDDNWKLSRGAYMFIIIGVLLLLGAISAIIVTIKPWAIGAAFLLVLLLLVLAIGVIHYWASNNFYLTRIQMLLVCFLAFFLALASFLVGWFQDKAFVGYFSFLFLVAGRALTIDPTVCQCQKISCSLAVMVQPESGPVCLFGTEFQKNICWEFLVAGSEQGIEAGQVGLRLITKTDKQTTVKEWSISATSIADGRVASCIWELGTDVWVGMRPPIDVDSFGRSDSEGAESKVHIMDVFLWGRCLTEDEIASLPAAMSSAEYSMIDLPDDNWQWADSPSRVDGWDSDPADVDLYERDDVDWDGQYSSGRKRRSDRDGVVLDVDSFTRTLRKPRVDTQKEINQHMLSVEIAVKEALLARGESHFTDQEFPPNDRSLFMDPDNPPSKLQVVSEWMRPTDIVKEKHLDTVAHYNTILFNQGRLGDCWFLSAVAVLTEVSRISKVIITPEYSQEGIYTVRFCIQGDWVPVVVDDWIPCESPGKPAFSTSRKGNEMWVSLLEKAYAKLHSSYEALEGGLVQDALVDLTGGAGEEIDMRSAEAQIDLASGRLGQTMEFFGCLDKISRYILGVSFLRTTAGVRNYQSSHDSMMFYIGMRILKTRGRRAAYNIYLHESVGGTDYVNSREISCEMVLDPDPKGMPNSPTLLLTGIERGERMVCPLRMDEASCLILGSPSLLNVISAWVLEVSKANRRKMVH
ncbi:Calpain-type cysteine protease DEK1 [Capsicum chinense]|nr:Calpain-type cysteine protease DEK1 [Capsicum chinense]